MDGVTEAEEETIMAEIKRPLNLQKKRHRAWLLFATHRAESCSSLPSLVTSALVVD